jgi:hypothetical protein
MEAIGEGFQPRGPRKKGYNHFLKKNQWCRDILQSFLNFLFVWRGHAWIWNGSTVKKKYTIQALTSCVFPSLFVCSMVGRAHLWWMDVEHDGRWMCCERL